MEPMRLIDFLLAAVSASLGWWGKIVWESVKELRRDLRDLENGIPREYVRKSDWDRATDRISEEIRALLEAYVIAGASPGGTFKLQLASETAGTNVTMKAGSFLKYRTVP